MYVSIPVVSTNGKSQLELGGKPSKYQNNTCMSSTFTLDDVKVKRGGPECGKNLYRLLSIR